MIKTIKELKRAFSKGLVDEVSPNLILNSPGSESLYPINMNIAWIHSSAGLYNLLNVNSRNPVKIEDNQSYNSSKSKNILELNPLSIYAAQRGVGFDFGFTKQGKETNNYPYPPQPDKALTTTLWVAFDITKGSFKTLSGLPAQKPIKKDFDKFKFKKTIPTQTSFENQTLELITTINPADLNASVNAIKEASAYLNQKYADNRKTPVQITAELFGVEFPYFFNLSGGTPGIQSGSLGFPTQGIPKLYRKANYNIAREATKTLPSNASSSYIISSEEAMRLLYKGFLEDRINKLQNLQKDDSQYEHLIKEIAIGLRVFQTSPQLQSTPLNTGSNGSGYSNAANPLVGRTYTEISIPSDQKLPIPIPTWSLDSFSGQEYLIDNLLLPDSVIKETSDHHFVFDNPKKAGWLGIQSSPTKSGSTLKYSQGESRLEATPKKPISIPELSEGWFSLSPQKPIPDGAKGKTISSYRNNHEITSSTKKHAVYDTNTLSSDTITAENLEKKDANTLQPSTIVKHNKTSIPLSDVNNLINKLVPQKFSTYFATAGGIDRITGSKFIDIIVGPNARNQHGTLRFDAGAGNDIVSPGRGGSIGLLGEGRDKVILGKGDLFGQTILLDFDENNDKIYLQKGIKHKIDSANPSLCMFFPSNETSGPYNTKSILLSSESDQSWENVNIKTLV